MTTMLLIQWMVAVIRKAHILLRRSHSRNENESTANVQKVVNPHTGCSAEWSNAHISADQMHSQPIRLVNIRNTAKIGNIRRVSRTGANNDVPTKSSHGEKFSDITLFCGGNPAKYKKADTINVGNTANKYAAATYWNGLFAKANFSSFDAMLVIRIKMSPFKKLKIECTSYRSRLVAVSCS